MFEPGDVVFHGRTSYGSMLYEAIVDKVVTGKWGGVEVHFVALRWHDETWKEGSWDYTHHLKPHPEADRVWTEYCVWKLTGENEGED